MRSRRGGGLVVLGLGSSDEHQVRGRDPVVVSGEGTVYIDHCYHVKGMLYEQAE